MADSGEATNDNQITFKVKASETTHTITISESATVLDLKTKLAGPDYENIPADRQRLIYSGRVLKDGDALSVYKVKNLNTIHLVKSAASNPASTASASSSAPAQPAIPTNMAAGTSASNPLAGLTGARFAGHASLPSRDIFGADGGMGAPPSEEQMADILSNPMMAQTMNEALNNPAFIDLMIQSNPMLANMPNARELLQSPAFRQMMTNPEAIRTAARMRRMFGGGGEAAFPAPGVTDNTPAAGGNNAAQNPFGLFGGGDPASLFGPGGANPFGASPFNPFGAPPAATNPPTGGAAPAAPAQNQTNATSAEGDAAAAAPTASQGQGAAAQPPFNPFAALFNPPAGGQPAGSPAGAANPFGGPAMNPELLSQLMQTLTGASAPAGPPDNRPPEERYAEQLRQLNDMGFFDFDRNVAALRRSGGSVQGAIEHLLNGS
ncbi:hypothetical protein QBC42DRAFT_17659 [Cladorrhinum samala]|uniref:Deubiquitination-protection protein dph1 n=1 Tax=Cladorrhinum samala TaxID=585594 RepID=A0AAV9HI97_9PEZI|nr:hypothetical protein QBC42DRAFT_17659 [Cladorrhinum samala]